MIWKILLTLGALILVWTFLFRAAGPWIRPKVQDGRKSAKATVKTQDLIKCRSCGIYLPAGQACGCKDRA